MTTREIQGTRTSDSGLIHELWRKIFSASFARFRRSLGVPRVFSLGSRNERASGAVTPAIADAMAAHSRSRQSGRGRTLPAPTLRAVPSLLLLLGSAGCGESPAPLATEEPSPSLCSPAAKPNLDSPPLSEGELEPIPYPDASQLEPDVHEQLDDRRQRLEAESTKPTKDSALLADLYGSLGNHYHAYELMEAAKACYRNAQRLVPEDERWPYFLGQLYRFQGLLGDALIEFEKALARNDSRLATQLAFAEVCLEEGRLGESRETFEKCLAKEPQCVPAKVGLGRIAYSNKRYDEAVEHFQGALEIEPTANAIHYELAMAYRGLGDRDKATEHLALRGPNPPKDRDPWMRELNQLATGQRLKESRAARLVREGAFAEAEVLLREAVQADPDSVVVRTNFGTALSNLGRDAEALMQFHEALRIEPDHTQAHYNVAVLLSRFGHEERAVAHYRDALNGREDFQEAHRNLAQSLRRLGRFEEAEQHLGRLVELDPGHAEARYLRALTLARLEKWSDVRDCLERAHQVLPDHEGITHALARILAAAPAKEVRDGPRSLELAQKVLVRDRTAERLETLAMSLAENRDFTQAVGFQEKLLFAATKRNRQEMIPRLQANLDRYKENKACRIPWPPDGPSLNPEPRPLVPLPDGFPESP